MYSYEEEIIVNIRKIMHAIDRHSSFMMKIFGLTIPQLLCLKTISESGPIAPGSLSKTVNLSHATVTGIISRLEKAELIKKIPDKYDRRRVLIKVTRKGSSLLKKAPSMLHEFFLKKLSQLPDWEKTLILSALQKVVAILDAEEVEATPIFTTGLIESEKDVTDCLLDKK